MTDAEMRNLLGWINARARAGCFSHKRSERDQALCDISFHTSEFVDCWTSPQNPEKNGRVWYGESP